MKIELQHKTTSSSPGCLFNIVHMDRDPSAPSNRMAPENQLYKLLVLGIVDAVVGGWLFNNFGAAGVTGLDLYSLLVAVIGAVALLVVDHAIRRIP
jgi:hypothetical protein